MKDKKYILVISVIVWWIIAISVYLPIAAQGNIFALFELPPFNFSSFLLHLFGTSLAFQLKPLFILITLVAAIVLPVFFLTFPFLLLSNTRKGDAGWPKTMRFVSYLSFFVVIWIIVLSLFV